MGWESWSILVLPYLSAVTCQIIKFVNFYIIKRKINFYRLVEMGGMPSAHSAATVTLTTLMGIYKGIKSPLFAITVFISLFIMGEAAGVRRAAGRQAELLNQLVEEFSKDGKISREKLKVFIGHTPFEVIIGSILGFAFAFAFIGG